eukprot:TRINITY_DN21052_c0_g1_i1.p1 TRINITY_DN21052_c0_g1~~TRINITY_DN21052_c0_g1_i1.p1  ORF type:complete len:396 (-),score=191.89 TRINITY_DN21052_c0_g1_i1:104-1291(-)
MKLTTVLVALVAVAVGFVVKLAHDANEFTTLSPHGTDGCVLVKQDGVGGLEDMQVVRRYGEMIMSNDPYREEYLDSHVGARATARNGNMLVYDVTQKIAQFRVVSRVGAPSDEFHPHGLYVLELDDKDVVYVVNHRSDGDHVEVYDLSVVEPGDDDEEEGEGGTSARARKQREREFTMTFKWEASGPLLGQLNDVMALDERSFFATNWLAYDKHSFMGHVSVYGQMPWTYVTYCELDANDVPQCRKVADGLRMANGLMPLNDNKQIVLIDTIEQAVLVYDRDPNTNDLTLNRKTILQTGCDNLSLDEQGRMYIGCHPKLLTFVKYSKDPTRLHAPSQALRITFDTESDGANDKIEELLLTNGEDFSASSVATPFGNDLYIGAVYAPGMFKCPLKQ